MGNKTTSIGMSKLLANASKMEKEIKETENVAPTITVEAEQTKQNGEEQPQEVKEVIKPEENVLSEKKNKDEQVLQSKGRVQFIIPGKENKRSGDDPHIKRNTC